MKVVLLRCGKNGVNNFLVGGVRPMRNMRFSSDKQRRAVFSKMNVTRGARFEGKIRSRLSGSDCVVSIRSAGSRSLWDVVCITPTKVRLIQAKTSGYLTPKERKDMLADIKRMPSNIQAEVEYYKSPKVVTNKTIKKADETDWDKVEERLDYFSEVRGFKNEGAGKKFSNSSYESIGERPHKTFVITKHVGDSSIPINITIKEDYRKNLYVNIGEASVVYDNAVKEGFSKALVFQKLKEGIDAGDRQVFLSSDDVSDLESFGVI